MDRSDALSITILSFIVFLLISYYGARITFWSSINLSMFTSLVILFTSYPLGKIADDAADFTLYIYAGIVITSILLLLVYILNASLNDVRCD